MEWKAGRCKTSTPSGIFIVIPSLEGWPTKAKEAPSPHEVRLALRETNPVFQCLRGKIISDKSLVLELSGKMISTNQIAGLYKV